MESTATKQKSSRAGRTIGGSILAVAAVVVLAAGGVALWANAAERDGAGYFSAHGHRYQTPTRAIATDTVTIGSHVPNWLIGNVRLAAASEKPVFVGIAAKADVDRYLAGVARADATDLDLDPFRVTYVTRPGTANPGRPADRPIWAASASGTGSPALTWKLRAGAWSVVVMNADGSPGVAAEITAGAKFPSLIWIGLGLASFGAVLLGGAALLLVGGRRAPRTAGMPTPAV